jgi:hypothetical protein
LNAPEQFVLIGVTRARAQWSADLVRWSTSGTAPVEFVRCLSADEAHAVLGSGRRASALLVDARGPGVDRDLIDAAKAADVPTIVVTDGVVHRDWDALGCAAVIDHALDPTSLLEALGRHCVPVDRSRRPGRAVIGDPGDSTRGNLIAVVGRGGSGTSTVAMALTQALASDPGRDVLLVDGAGRADLAMYHHVGDVIPGLPELVEAHRSDRLDPEEVRRLTFEIDQRGYSLLLGRRSVAEWVTLRRRAVSAALDAVRRSFDLAVLDLDADLDGQTATGSVDLEDRHSVTLCALDSAELVLVVGRAGLHGLHGLTGVLDEVLGHGVPPHRVLPVLIGGAMRPLRRVAVSSSIDHLIRTDDRDPVCPPLHLPSIRRLEDVHHAATALPAALCRPLRATVAPLLDDVGARPSRTRSHERIRPGELAAQAIADEVA